MKKFNGKPVKFRKLTDNARINNIKVKEGDFFYIRVPQDTTKEEARIAIDELQRIFPKNFVFIIPDHLTIQKLNDAELKRLGLMKIPVEKLVDDPMCPKCKSKNTMKKYNSLQFQKVCLERACGYKGGWLDRSLLEGGEQKKIIQS